MRFLLLLLLFISLPLMANTQLSTQIHDIDMGAQGNEEPLIFLTSGDVVRFKNFDKNVLLQLREAIKKKTWFRVTLNEKREILQLEEIAAPLSAFHEKMLHFSDAHYRPSYLKSMDQARSMFYEARTNHKESQCFNRAHVWAYDWRIKHQLYSSKVWLFFTRKYIRKFKFQWWFHVAPMAHVNINGEMKERVMDIKYARGPIKLKTWTDIFMRDYADCPVVEKYSDHANFPESGTCFVMKSSMYYYQPVDLEQRDLTGIEKSHWMEPEVKQAFLEAMDITL